MNDSASNTRTAAPDDQGERMRRIAAGLMELRDAARGLGPLSPGPEWDLLRVALQEFTSAMTEALSGPKAPRKVRRNKFSITDGWVGCG